MLKYPWTTRWVNKVNSLIRSNQLSNQNQKKKKEYIIFTYKEASDEQEKEEANTQYNTLPPPLHEDISVFKIYKLIYINKHTYIYIYTYTRSDEEK